MDPFMFRHHGTDIDIQYKSARDDWHQISRESRSNQRCRLSYGQFLAECYCCVILCKYDIEVKTFTFAFAFASQPVKACVCLTLALVWAPASVFASACQYALKAHTCMPGSLCARVKYVLAASHSMCLLQAPSL